METPTQMHTSLRDYLDEPTEGYWTNTELAMRLYTSGNRVVRKIASLESTFFMRTTTIDFVADQGLYDLPRNARLGARWDHALKYNASGEIQAFVYDGLVRDRVFDDLVKVSARNPVFRLSLQGQQARITPEPSDALAGAVEIAYVPVFGDPHEGPVSSATSTTLVFPTTPTFYRVGSPSVFDDEYIGMQIAITAGLGVGQIREITDYVGSTRQVTIGAAWTTTPDTTSTYAVICPVPDDFHDVVVLDAALTAASKSTRRRYQEIANTHQMREAEMFDWVEQRQTFRNEIVIPDLSAGAY